MKLDLIFSKVIRKCKPANEGGIVFLSFLVMASYKVMFISLWVCAFVLLGVDTAFEATYVDEMGRKMDIPHNPEKIVSLAPSITETLCFLNLGERIVGVTQFSNYPEESKTKAKVGSYINLNVEKIVSLNPDLIIGIADGNKKESVDILEAFGYPVYAVNPRCVKDIFRTIENIGEITGSMDRARELVGELRNRMHMVETRTRGAKIPRVFFQIGINPLITVGKNTFHNDLTRMAGGVNISGEEKERYPRYSLENVLLKAPEVIIISSMHRGGGFDRKKEEWMKWKSLPAVKNERIYIIDSDLVDHPSPRIIDGLEELARLIHPELFE
jgi:iron complex transport system substrate-binding protein